MLIRPQSQVYEASSTASSLLVILWPACQSLPETSVHTTNQLGTSLRCGQERRAITTNPGTRDTLGRPHTRSCLSWFAVGMVCQWDHTRRHNYGRKNKWKAQENLPCLIQSVLSLRVDRGRLCTCILQVFFCQTFERLSYRMATASFIPDKRNSSFFSSILKILT